MFLTGKENSSPNKYRSMSMETPHQLTGTRYPSFVVEDDGNREMAIDVNPNGRLLQGLLMMFPRKSSRFEILIIIISS